MKIDESSVVLNGRHRFESECTSEVSTQCGFRTVLDNVSEASETSETAAVDRPGRGDKVRLMLEQLIAEIIALISGQDKREGVNLREIVQPKGVQSPSETRARPQGGREFFWESVTTETIREHESSQFSATGVVRTADGKSIDFTLDLAMCRDFQCERKSVDSGAVRLRDPLVINFDGKAVELADSRFDFDLDSDGVRESMHGLAGGSGFLAFDRNGDGRISDGSELFGARSGDGFADLALLDEDGNDWLDEADAAFASLKAWSPAAGGDGELSSLREKGIGAIYLGSTETPFSLKDDENRMRGQVRASGVYLREDGRAGSLQQIDLVV